MSQLFFSGSLLFSCLFSWLLPHKMVHCFTNFSLALILEVKLHIFLVVAIVGVKDISKVKPAPTSCNFYEFKLNDTAASSGTSSSVACHVQTYLYVQDSSYTEIFLALQDRNSRLRCSGQHHCSSSFTSSVSCRTTRFGLAGSLVAREETWVKQPNERATKNDRKCSTPIYKA